MMTEAEARQVVFQQFTGETGFLLDLRMGRGINQSAVEQTRLALDTLRQSWSDRHYVPKDLVIHLMDVRTAILSSWGLYPELHAQLEALVDDMTRRIRACLS